MNALQNQAFGQLLTAWNRREQARSAGDVRHLAEARFELDRARAELRHVMTGIR